MREPTGIFDYLNFWTLDNFETINVMGRVEMNIVEQQKTALKTLV